ncbi:MAG: hypothetical protein LRY26_01090 [Bacilli bacterium]|nr:hypothetical protein [Bacilli bacterium]
MINSNKLKQLISRKSLKNSDRSQEFNNILKELIDNKELEKRWNDYQNKNIYINQIHFYDTINSIRGIINILGEKNEK